MWGLGIGSELNIGEPTTISSCVGRTSALAGGRWHRHHAHRRHGTDAEPARRRCADALRRRATLASWCTATCSGAPWASELRTFTDDTRSVHRPARRDPCSGSRGADVGVRPMTLLEAARTAWAQAGRDAADLRFETFGNTGRFEAQPFWSRTAAPRPAAGSAGGPQACWMCSPTQASRRCSNASAANAACARWTSAAWKARWTTATFSSATTRRLPTHNLRLRVARQRRWRGAGFGLPFRKHGPTTPLRTSRPRQLSSGRRAAHQAGAVCGGRASRIRMPPAWGCWPSSCWCTSPPSRVFTAASSSASFCAFVNLGRVTLQHTLGGVGEFLVQRLVGVSQQGLDGSGRVAGDAVRHGLLGPP